MVVISHFKLYPALFSLKWLICIPNISAVRGNVVFETLHDFYRTAIFSIGEIIFSNWELEIMGLSQKSANSSIFYDYPPKKALT